MTFEEYLAKHNLILLPWQKKASEKFLKSVYDQREIATGKSFLVGWLCQFIIDHGNEFEI